MRCEMYFSIRASSDVLASRNNNLMIVREENTVISRGCNDDTRVCNTRNRSGKIPLIPIGFLLLEKPNCIS